MKKSLKAAKKVGVSLIGIPILILGIILIPLPGPGLLVSLLGLIILSTEFDWAHRYQMKARSELKKIYDKAKERTDAAKKDNGKTDGSS